VVGRTGRREVEDVDGWKKKNMQYLVLKARKMVIEA
jgi:hypothetical protein